MRSAIIAAFLPWMMFFGFADGTLIGLERGIIFGGLALFVFDYVGLRKRFLLSWAAVLFFVAMFALGLIAKIPFVLHYSSLLESVVLVLVCFLSLILGKPFSLPYARLKTPESYHHHPLLIAVNSRISFVWGLVFLICGLSVARFEVGLGTKTLLLEVIPTTAMVFGILFTIFFPDWYKWKISKSVGLLNIPGISEMKIVSLGKISIAYRMLGSGPLLVLFNDEFRNMHYWDPFFLERLSQNFSLLIFDYPGVGYSAFEQMAYTVENLADCLQQLLKQLALKPMGLLGYGMGGWVATSLLLKYPKFAEKLILISSDLSGYIDKQQSKTHYKEAGRVMKNFKQIEHEALLVGDISAAMHQEIDKLRKRWRDDHGVNQQIKNIGIPVVFIIGMHDDEVLLENILSCRKQFAQSKLLKYEAAGHLLLYQYAMIVADDIVAFMSEEI